MTLNSLSRRLNRRQRIQVANPPTGITPAEILRTRQRRWGKKPSEPLPFTGAVPRTLARLPHLLLAASLLNGSFAPLSYRSKRADCPCVAAAEVAGFCLSECGAA